MKSAELRDEASKCLSHAEVLADTQTQRELRELAAQFNERAQKMDSKKAELLALGYPWSDYLDDKPPEWLEAEIKAISSTAR